MWSFSNGCTAINSVWLFFINIINVLERLKKLVICPGTPKCFVYVYRCVREPCSALISRWKYLVSAWWDSAGFSCCFSEVITTLPQSDCCRILLFSSCSFSLSSPSAFPCASSAPSRIYMVSYSDSLAWHSQVAWRLQAGYCVSFSNRWANKEGHYVQTLFSLVNKNHKCKFYDGFTSNFILDIIFISQKLYKLAFLNIILKYRLYEKKSLKKIHYYCFQKKQNESQHTNTIW